MLFLCLQVNGDVFSPTGVPDQVAVADSARQHAHGRVRGSTLVSRHARVQPLTRPARRASHVQMSAPTPSVYTRTPSQPLLEEPRRSGKCAVR